MPYKDGKKNGKSVIYYPNGKIPKKVLIKTTEKRVFGNTITKPVDSPLKKLTTTIMS